MRRMIVTLGVAAGVVLLAAPAALAKGNGTAFISGPGSGTGSSVNITIRGGLTDSSEPVFWQFVSDMGLFETKSQLKVGPGQAPPGFGPRYDVMLFFGPEPGRTGMPQLVHLDLYPYAKGGPWSFVPAGQRGRFTGEIPSGWYAAPSSLLDSLVTLGFPAHAPGVLARAATGGTAAEARSHGGSTAWPAIVAAAALAAMVALGAVLGRARARTVRAA